ncbi:ABC transporter substrate-binding protein [Streptomyces sp. NPDC001514]
MTQQRRGKAASRAAIAVAASVALTLTGCAKSDDTGNTDRAAAAIAAVPAAFAGRAATGSPVKIGLLNPEGSAAANFPESRVAAEAVVAYANEHLGGLAGHKIELVRCDLVAEDPSTMTACANQMVQDQVAAVVATTGGNGELMAPIITKAGIAYTNFQGTSATEFSGPNAFLWNGGVAATTLNMAKFAAKAGVKNVTMYVTAVGDIPAHIGAATPILKAMGVDSKIVPIPPGSPDVTGQVQAGLKDKPGAITVLGDVSTCIATLKGLKLLNADVDRYLTQKCADPAVYEAVPDALDGAYLFTTAEGTSDHDEAKIYRAVMAKYAPADANLGGNATAGYQTMLAITRMVNAGIGTNEPTAPNIIAALKAAKAVPLPVGHGITLTCDGKALPKLPNVCSVGGLVGEIKQGTANKFNVLQ